ncbi:MAG: hypothetical protein RSA01_00975 [Clostridium sp.]
MIYVVLIGGLLLIYFSLRRGQVQNVVEAKEKNFDTLLENDADSFYEREILKSYVELEKRVEILEEKLLQYENVSVIEDKEIPENDEKYIEGILEVIDNTKDTYVKEEEEKTEEVVVSSNNSSILNNEVITLYNEGKSVEDIASILNIGKGEVLLRIGLQKRQQ